MGSNLRLTVNKKLLTVKRRFDPTRPIEQDFWLLNSSSESDAYTEQEIQFLNRLLDQGNVEPELITDDINLRENIKNHPAIIWSAQLYSSKAKKKQ